MPAIDWTNHGLHLTLAAVGVVLILLGIVFHFVLSARLKALAVLVGIGGGLTAGIALGLHLIPIAPPADHGKAAEPSPPEPISQSPPILAPTTPEWLDRFRQVTPVERMGLLVRLPDGAAAWYTVERGDVASVLERGTLESADNADMVCKVHARKPSSSVATIIKWVVDDEATVKKGQLLIELDDSELQEQLQAQKIRVEQKKAELVRIQKQAELDIEQAQLTLERAGHQLTLAERDWKAYRGEDADRKKGLELQIKEARQLVKTRDFQRTTTKARTEADRQAARADLDAETARVKELEADIANCKMYAPRDGQVVHYLSEVYRGPIVGAGEPVLEGQKLLCIPDLSKMQVQVHIPQAQIARVRHGQTAAVRVDAFPDRTLAAKVERIGQVPERRRDRKVYPVTITLTDKLPGLRPGMNSEVRIEAEPRRNVLRVPVSALLYSGRKAVCFVRSGKEIQEREVVVGLGDKDFVEVVDGLKEGELVLRDLRAAAKQLGDGSNKGVAREK
jgi:RND family efflux transporter MFP subunit